MSKLTFEEMKTVYNLIDKANKNQLNFIKMYVEETIIELK